MIDCPGFFGDKASPQTKCGALIPPEAFASIRMPRDPDIVQLQFFTRVFTRKTEWHLKRAGTLDLPKRPI